MKGIEKKLSNKEFVSKAPQDVVEIQERRLEEAGHFALLLFG